MKRKGGLGKAPSPPKAPAIQMPSGPVLQAPKVSDAEAQAAEAEQKRLARNRRGLTSTIATSPLGLLADETVGKAKLGA